jgi:hypothetical protein
MIALAAIVILSLSSTPAAAQWLNYKTPGIPRTPDGKPNLSAPVPRMADGKPDLSGLWRGDQNGGAETGKAMMALKAQPWAEELSKKRRNDLGKDDMSVLCLPLGPRVGAGVGKIIQTPGIVVMLLGDLTYRQVFLDGRQLPKDPNPSWMGYSVGRWDGDTLVVESNGFNDRTWLDGLGHPHTEALHVTERYRRRNFGHMDLQVTLDDPKAFTEPWTVPIKLELDADSEPLEYVCAENERDRPHLVGKASDEEKNEVKIAPEILSRYVGVYEFKPPERPDLTIRLNVSLAGDRLMLDQNGGPKLPLAPSSETKFFLPAGGVHIEFVKDEHGVYTSLIAQIVEGEVKAVRK